MTHAAALGLIRCYGRRAMPEPEWDAERRRLRRRAAAQMLLILGPIILAALALGVIFPIEHEASDPRSAPGYPLAMAAGFGCFVVALMVLAYRTLHNSDDQ
jgi:hypothetical protein